MPVRRWQRALSPAIFGLFVHIWSLSCKDDRDVEEARDAAAGVGDALPPDTSGEAGGATALDFTVAGCPSLDARRRRCEGVAPLALTFVPVASTSFLRYRWDFGDGATSGEETPSHTYDLPGVYEVTLRGVGARDVVQTSHQAFVEVKPSPLGRACDRDAQCEGGLSCLCAQGAGCGTAFARGFCARPCGAEACPAGAACADLGKGAKADAGVPWQRSLCLPTCASDEACGPGQRCRPLPEAAAMGRWTRVCFGDAPADLGAPCRDAEGAPEDAACVSGLCADLGARGLCAEDCSVSACGPGTGCAVFKDGRRLCLPACAAGALCNDDPLLACEAPGGAGPLAFTVDPGGRGASHCAPRSCKTNGDCGAGGVCRVESGAGHCVRAE
jgi:hypothetical protein